MQHAKACCAHVLPTGIPGRGPTVLLQGLGLRERSLLSNRLSKGECQALDRLARSSPAKKLGSGEGACAHQQVTGNQSTKKTVGDRSTSPCRKQLSSSHLPKPSNFCCNKILGCRPTACHRRQADVKSGSLHYSCSPFSTMTMSTASCWVHHAQTSQCLLLLIVQGYTILYYTILYYTHSNHHLPEQLNS